MLTRLVDLFPFKFLGVPNTSDIVHEVESKEWHPLCFNKLINVYVRCQGDYKKTGICIGFKMIGNTHGF